MNKNTVNRKTIKIVSFIKSKRLEKNFSQEAIAELLEIDQSNYSRIENGKCSMNLDQLTKILGLYEIELDELLSKKE